jgi:hypothetical protein
MSDSIHWSTRDWVSTGTDMVEIDATVNRAQEILAEVGAMLLEKNKAYGDSALSPIRIFSKLESSSAIKVRIDDKLSRIRNVGVTEDTEDSVRDLIGYLVLLLVAIERGE